MKDFTIEDRIEQAVAYFQSGYNCAQSVFLAYSDLFDIDEAMAKKMSVSFGGGLGRMREVCGTVSAMSMLAGFRYPVLDTLDREARKQNYQIVQKMAELFKEKNGAIVCRDLLRNIKTDNSPMPSDRTAEYYKKRPCARIVADAAQIAGRMLKGELEE
jgi:C_GCAxxG_C_C family probable redox protein